MNIIKITHKLKVQIHYFSGKLSKGLPKVVGRFIEEMIYGIQCRGSVRLSEIARSLNEGITLKKVIERLSNNLARIGLWEEITGRIITEGTQKVKEDTLLVLDISDISKPYAKKMEHLARVRDGSTGEIAKGYWTCEVIGLECGSNDIVPLYKELYSQKAKGFQSENRQIEKAILKVSSAIENRGIWVLDRGGDRMEIYRYLLEHKGRFIIRMNGDRHIIHKGKKVIAEELARSCQMLYSDKIIKEDENEEKAYFIRYGFRKVKLPGHKEKLYMVVANGFGEKPMMLLTNIPLRKKRSVLWWIIEAYLSRWKIEETIRYIKQSYALEDIRLLTYERLQNMMALVLAASFFAAFYLGEGIKLRILVKYVFQAAKNIFGIPDFRYYAISNGIRELLSHSWKGTIGKSMPSRDSPQLTLFDI